MRAREEQLEYIKIAFIACGYEARGSWKCADDFMKKIEQRVRAEITNQEQHRLSKNGNAYANATLEAG